MKITSAIGGRSCGQDVAIGNNRCNTRVCHLAAEKAPVPPCHNWHKWRYTFGVHHVRDTHCSFRQRNPSARGWTACVHHGTLDSGSVHSSAPGSHKIPAHQR